MQNVAESPLATASPSETVTASRSAVAGWVSKGLGNTLQSQTMIANYFPVWVVAVMGGSDSLITLSNTLIMVLMIGLGPWLGAVSDLLPRRELDAAFVLEALATETCAAECALCHVS